MLARSAVLAVVVLSAPAAVGAQRNARLISRVDSLAQETLRRSPAPGLSIAIMRGKDTILARGYGFARLSDSTRATERTVYPIASITKQFTAAAVLRLSEQRKLKLTDPIGRFLPGYADGEKSVTVKHLLGHISGLAPVPLLDGSTMAPDPPDPGLVVTYLRTATPSAPPGEQFAYNNAGYYLLGSIIESASGQPYQDYLRDALLIPSALGSTRECTAGDPSMAAGYDVVDSTLVPNPAPLPMPGFSAGGLCSTVLDLVTWERALGERKAINNLSWHQMIEPVELKDLSRASYGYGVTLGHLSKHPIIGHGGATPGFASQVLYLPDEAIAVAVLANSGDAQARRLADQVALLVLGVPEPRVKDVALAATGAVPYEGIYVFEGDSTTIEVQFRVGRLEAKMGAGAPIRLLYQGSHEFVSESDPTTRLFFRVRNDAARILEFHAGDLVILANRLSQDGK